MEEYRLRDAASMDVEMKPGLQSSAPNRPSDSQPLLTRIEEVDENAPTAPLGRANPDPGLTPTGGTW